MNYVELDWPYQGKMGIQKAHTWIVEDAEIKIICLWNCSYGFPKEKHM